MSPQEILNTAPAVRQVKAMNVGEELTISLWQNDGRDITYENVRGHTFSYYVSGGHGSVLKHRPGAAGGPGKICLIPEGSNSHWGHASELEFMHLHIPDHELRRRYCETFDKDARLCSLPELAFSDIPTLASVSRRLLFMLASGDPFLISCGVSNVLASVLEHTNERSLPALKGGLSSRNAHRARDFIEAHLDDSLNLREIATTVGLSEFHFQRMFQESFGVSPALWVSWRRISRAQDLLRSNVPIAEIAAQCGFSDQSHLTRVFKRMAGVTPGAFRKGLMKA